MAGSLQGIEIRDWLRWARMVFHGEPSGSLELYEESTGLIGRSPLRTTALPLDEHGGGVVAQVAGVGENCVHQPAQGLWCWLCCRVLLDYELDEPFEAEYLAAW
jgi:hypothetical protein